MKTLLAVIVGCALAFAAAVLMSGCSQPSWRTGISADQVGNQRWEAGIGGSF